MVDDVGSAGEFNDAIPLAGQKDVNVGDDDIRVGQNLTGHLLEATKDGLGSLCPEPVCIIGQQGSAAAIVFFNVYRKLAIGVSLLRVDVCLI